MFSLFCIRTFFPHSYVCLFLKKKIHMFDMGKAVSYEKKKTCVQWKFSPNKSKFRHISKSGGPTKKDTQTQLDFSIY